MFIVGSILGCVHSNHAGTFWQEEIRAIGTPLISEGNHTLQDRSLYAVKETQLGGRRAARAFQKRMFGRFRSYFAGLVGGLSLTQTMSYLRSKVTNMTHSVFDSQEKRCLTLLGIMANPPDSSLAAGMPSISA